MTVANGSSAESSVLDKEVETQSRPIASADEKDQGKELTDITSDTEEDRYPSLWKLGLVTAALSLSIFCVALVCM